VDARTDRIAALTGLRFAAALGILLFHYGAPLVAGLPGWVERVRAGGHVWVGLFYVLSGFVLARAHPAPMGPAARRAFWADRLARLYPAYVLAFVLSAPFALERWEGGGSAGALKAAAVGAAALLLVQAWAPPVARLWNAPGWSTSAVAAFYAAFPFVAAWLGRRSRRGLAAALAGAWALSLAFPLAWLALAPDGHPATITRWDWSEPAWLEALKFHPVARAGEFVFGVALGLLHRRGLALARGGGAAALLALGAAIAIVASGAIPYPLLHNGALVPLFAIAVVGLAGGGPVARALGSEGAQRLGEASFALYALQEPLWRIARSLAPDPSAPPSAAFVAIFTLGAIAASLAVATLVERPARRAVRAWLTRPSAPALPAGSAPREA
jgi:peptidoglycan/LPS O-acetylase OafA/YrhL